MQRELRVFDTTLRDGEQSPGCSMNLDEKLRMASQLERLGVDIIEAGFPIASQGEFEAVKAVSGLLKKTSVAALCRTRKEDVERAWEAIQDAKFPRIHTFIATSDIHMHHKLSMTPREVLASVEQMVAYARSFTDDVEFSAEDASRSEIDFLAEVVEVAIKSGATTINLPDTVGYATPVDYGNMFAEIRRRVPGSDMVTFSAHCHNDLGLAVANSLAAFANGADQVEATINGIGERAGNASLEEIVMAFYVRTDAFNATSRINTRELYPTSQLLSSITGVKVQPHKAIVGENAFAHEAGIHQDGMLKNALTYEIMTPESVGLKRAMNLVLGKHSGRHALQKSCAELGYQLNKEQLEQVYKVFLQVADEKKSVGEQDLVDILKNHSDIITTGKQPADLRSELTG